jgi:hypothetical protein
MVRNAEALWKNPRDANGVMHEYYQYCNIGYVGNIGIAEGGQACALDPWI